MSAGPALGFAVVLSVAFLFTPASRAAQPDKTRHGKAQAVALVKKVAYLIQHPESITARELERRFPGRYTARVCRPEDASCGHDNPSSRPAPMLASYYVRNPRKGDAAPIHLYFTFPHPGACVSLEELDALLGQRGKWTGVPPPQDAFGGPMMRIEDIRYEGINARDPWVHAAATLRNSCLSDLTVDLDAP